MFRDGLRAFRFLEEENHLPQVITTCSHLVDPVVLRLSGLSDSESDRIFSELSIENSSGFPLINISTLKPTVIMGAANSRLSRSVVIWKLLKRLIDHHNSSCIQYSAKPDDFVEVDGLEILHGDIPITEMGLSVRSLNALKLIGIQTAVQLSALSRAELMKVPNLGLVSIAEISMNLEKLGLSRPNEIRKVPAVQLLNKGILLEDLGLSTRTYNALKRMGIQNLKQVSALTDDELRDIRNFGEKSIQEVKDLLQSHKVELNSDSAPSLPESMTDDELYEWARSEIRKEIELLQQHMGKLGEVRVNYRVDRNLYKLTQKQNSLVLYSNNDNLDEVIKYLSKKLEDCPGSSIDTFILDLDSFTTDFLNYSNLRLTCYPSQSQRDSLLKYENEYSDDSVDLLKFDNFTLTLLRVSPEYKAVLLNTQTYFELLEQVNQNFITNRSVWDVIDGVVIFHERLGTFPNILGLVIAQHIAEAEKQSEIRNELNFLFETLTPTNAVRDLQILAMRIEGATLDKIGKEVGVTRERVRQILVKISPDLDNVIETLKVGIQEKYVEIQEQKFVDIFNKYGAIYKSELAHELGIDEVAAIKMTPKRFQKYIIDKSPEPVVTLTWSREQCLDAIRKASTYYFPIKQADYDHLISIGEIDGPSIQYMYLKHGQWTDLCAEAGVECAPALRYEYVRMWSDEELLSYARRFFMEPNTTGSYGGYDEWRDLQTDHVPSGVLIRNVFGSWATVRRKALESIREQKGLEVRHGI